MIFNLAQSYKPNILAKKKNRHSDPKSTRHCEHCEIRDSFLRSYAQRIDFNLWIKTRERCRRRTFWLSWSKYWFSAQNCTATEPHTFDAAVWVIRFDVDGSGIRQGMRPLCCDPCWLNTISQYFYSQESRIFVSEVLYIIY